MFNSIKLNRVCLYDPDELVRNRKVLHPTLHLVTFEINIMQNASLQQNPDKES